MIIRHLHIDNFGIFHDFDLDLDPGFNRFVWLNEAGKSTLLEFIRRIFWGFPDKRSKLNPYPALKGSGIYGGFLDVTMNDGRPLRLERRGERGKLKIIAPDGNTESVADIAPYTGISEIFYRNVCAVTLDELTAFAALDDPEIRNRLYGNALSAGGSSLSDLQEQLEREAEKIFKKRGSHNLLRQLATEFESSEKRLAEAASIMPAYEKAVLNAEKIEEESELLKNRISTLQAQIDTAEKALAAAELYEKLNKDEELFSRRPLPSSLPEPLAPFAEKAPAPPVEPDFPEIPLPPAPPQSAFLAGKCDISRAARVDDEELSAFSAWYNDWQKVQIPLLCSGLLLVLCLALFSTAFVLWFHKIFSAAVCLGTAVATLLPAAFLCGSFVRKWCRLAAAKKQKEDFFFRFAVNPAVNPEILPELLEHLSSYQASLREYETEMKSIDEQKRLMEKIRFEYDLHRKEYDRQCAGYAQRRELYDQKRASYEEECCKATLEVARYEGEKLALTKRRNELNELYGPISAERPDPELQETLKSQLRDLKRQLEENIKVSGAERREAALLLGGRDSAVELNIREQLRGRMRAAAERFLVLSAARICLEKAVERSEREHQPELLRKASDFMAQLTQDAYTRVYKSARENVLKIASPDAPDGKGISQLSRGTREQLFLALRLALIESLENSFEPLPVVFDDILVNFDNQRRPSARATLELFARNRQIILFECQQEL